MLPLHTFGKLIGQFPVPIVKVLDLGEALTTGIPHDRVLVAAEPGEVSFEALATAGFAGVLTSVVLRASPLPTIGGLREPAVVRAGDVIRIERGRGQLSVLYRRGANANALFVTERCNSFCLMCSQPPRNDNDDWRVEELKQLVALIDQTLPVLGVTGGEPTLLGARLADLFDHAALHLPTTDIHVLTNGRRFAEEGLVDLFAGVKSRVTWAIPLYADVAAVHDYVVQSTDAFNETLHALYNLAERQHRLEIRCVLHKETVPRLVQLAEFIYRNLPFVSHVAFMGLEPMGFARQNRDRLWVDPLDYMESLAAAVHFLSERNVFVSIYNLTLCVLPKSLWKFARRSISDWKNTYDSVCDACAARDQCAGFFASAGPNWKSRGIRPLSKGAAAQHEALVERLSP